MASTTLPASGDASHSKSRDLYEAFRVPWRRHVVTQAVHKFHGLWTRLGNLESKLLADVLAPRTIDRPIYIAGLARSGSTILLETVASYPKTASHRYRDFPFVFTPYWWNRYLDRIPRQQAAMKPRVHADGILVSLESPEALEEPLWMHFFRDSHCSAVSQVLDERVERPDFAKFYRNHLRKVLAVRNGTRYVCKGNYHISRLEYLLQLFPDARFVLPIRSPREHIASLMKQHRLFVEGESRHRRSLMQMQGCGHFEFGLDRRAINVGDGAARQVEDLWAEPRHEVRGWARYWSSIYGYVGDRLLANSRLRDAVLVVPYHQLCQQPEAMLARIEAHCEIACDRQLRQTLVQKFHAPTYYRPSFSPDDEDAICQETREVASRFQLEALARAA